MRVFTRLAIGAKEKENASTRRYTEVMLLFVGLMVSASSWVIRYRSVAWSRGDARLLRRQRSCSGLFSAGLLHFSPRSSR